MKLKKEILIPLAIAIFALIGLELQVLPYIPFGGGRWIDSISKNTSNRSLEVRGDVNVTGSYKINGSDLGAAAVNFDTIYSRGKDSTKFLTVRNRDNTFVGTNVFNGLTYTGVMETGNLTATGTFDVSGVSTFASNVQVDGLTNNGANADWTYNYLWRGLLPTGGNPYFSMSHGMTKRQYQNIKAYTVAIHHDSVDAGGVQTNQRGIYTLGSHYGSHTMYMRVDSININFEGVLAFKGDSIFVNFLLTNYPERTRFP